jgi:hypothetical protein
MSTDVLDDIIDVRRVDVRAGDVLVIRCRRKYITEDQAAHIVDRIRDKFPVDIKVMLVTEEFSIEVVRAET